MQKRKQYNNLIIYILIFTLIFPLLSGFVLISPVFAAEGGLAGLTGNKGIMSVFKGLLMLFFFSFLSNKDESSEVLDDSYQSAVQEEPNIQNGSSSAQRLDVTAEEFDWLAKGVYSESRGEPFEGQVAVASVIINRVLSSEFPNTVKGVILERPGGSAYAFSAVLDGQIHLTPDKTSYQAVDYALKGWDPTGGALYYYNPVKATASWIFENTTPKITIGNHIFADLKK